MSILQQHQQPQYSLVNILAFIGFLGTFIIFLILVIKMGWPTPGNRWFYVGAMVSYLITIFLNKLGYETIAKYLLTYIALIFCFSISIVNKMTGPIYINDYYVFRMIIIAISIFPILVFKYDQYIHLALNLLPAFLGLLLFDLLHDAFGIGIFSTGYVDKTYFMTTYVTLVCFFGLNAFLYALKRNNDIYLEKLTISNTELENQYEELQLLNEEVEKKNNLIVDQNNQLKDFSIKLKEKVAQRTSDLTKLNKELADQNVRLEQFTFITAHNIKSPIAQIKGLLNLLYYENGLGKSTKSILSKIEDSCLNLEEVITDLNKILNIKNHSHIIETVNLSEIMDHIIVNLKSEIRKNNITVKRNYHAIIEIDTIKAFMYSILFNLIQNAVKYHDPEEEQSVIEISMEDKNGSIYISITDNGVGFEQELVKDKLFQLYQRFNTSVIGKGLGLFLVKEQTEMLNGTIKVKSEKGKGTCFELSLPHTMKMEKKEHQKLI